MLAGWTTTGGVCAAFPVLHCHLLEGALNKDTTIGQGDTMDKMGCLFLKIDTWHSWPTSHL